MKTPDVKPNSATSRLVRSRGMRSIAIACALLGAAVAAQTALADCPPGYKHKGNQCIPAQEPRAPHAHYYTGKSTVTQPGATPLTRSPIHKPVPEMIDRSKVKPQPGVPIEHRSSASSTHGIIFVGGKNAINSQPVPSEHSALNPQPIPPGHSALNPQPIPPGHSLHKIPHPGTPITKGKPHWDIKANKGS